ncbi:MAG: hypothetical protein MJ206_01725 [Bacilli bacterium]|nr:hypothetical protein [Bacilli bacterium]
MKKAASTKDIQHQILLVDFLIFVFSLFIYLFIARGLSTYKARNVNDITIYLYIPLFIVLLFGFGFPIYIEKKYNCLKLNHFMLYLGAILAVTNLIAALMLPTNIYFSPNQTEPYILTPMVRIYSILCGLVMGFVPYLFFYLLPRRIRHKNYLNYIFYLNLIVLAVFVIISFFTDAENYRNILVNGLGEVSKHPIHGIAHKSAFGTHLMIGVFTLILIDIFNHKWPWLLLSIPMLLIQLCTFAKTPIIATWIIIFAYLIYKLCILAKKSRDNLIITSLVGGFVLIGIVVGSILIGFSGSGPLFSIKNFLINAFKNAQATFHSRTIIWSSILAIMGPLQIIFGYSLGLGGVAVHYAYAFNPDCPEDPSKIWHAHNAGLSILSEGGVFFLLLSLFLYVYLIYIAVKIYRQHKALSVFTIFFVVSQIVIGVFDDTHILNDTTDFLQNFVMILPVMAVYYMEYDQKEKAIRLAIVKQAESEKHDAPKKWYTKLDHNLLVHSAKNITEDLTHEH